MPAAFLKRWLYVINEEKFSKEEIEKDFDQFLKMFSWNFIQKHFIKEDNLTVTADEALAEAKAFAAAQFAQYGMPAAPDEMLENFAKQQILANKEQSQKIYEKLYETKVVEDVKGKIKVTERPFPPTNSQNWPRRYSPEYAVFGKMINFGLCGRDVCRVLL